MTRLAIKILVHHHHNNILFFVFRWTSWISVGTRKRSDTKRTVSTCLSKDKLRTRRIWKSIKAARESSSGVSMVSTFNEPPHRSHWTYYGFYLITINDEHGGSGHSWWRFEFLAGGKTSCWCQAQTTTIAVLALRDIPLPVFKLIHK